MRWLSVLAALMLVVAVGCSSEEGGGGASNFCGTPGSLGECSSGDICTNIAGDGNQCRTICVNQTDCPADQNCNGIANTTIKSCQPK